MRRFWFALLLLLAGSISVWAQNSANSRSIPFAYVFDPDQEKVAAINLLNGETSTALVSGSGDLERDVLALTPDGSKLVVLVAGKPGKTPHPDHKHPRTSDSAATIIDTKTMKPTQPIDLGWHLSNYSFNADNTALVTISSGYEVAKSKKNLSAEIITVNLSSGQATKRIPVSQPISDCLITKDGKTAVLLFAKRLLKHHGTAPAELQFVSIEKQAVVGKVTLDGDPGMPFFSPTGEFIYLLEQGEPSHNPRKNINGRIHVVSVNEMKMAGVLDAGSAPKIALPDDGAGDTLILSDGPPVPTANQIVDAELRVLRNASIVSLLKVGNGPKYLSFSPDKKRLYVTSSLEYNGYQGLVADRQLESNPSSYASTHKEFLYPSFDLLTAIDYTSFKQLGQVHLDGAVSRVLITPDGTRGFTLNPKSNRLQALDLDALRAGATISTGRNGIKTERFVMGSVEASASMFFPLAGIAISAANSLVFSPTNTLMSVRPDGAFVYVLNHGTNDVTVVNTKDSSVVDKIAGGGRHLQALEGGGVLAVIARDSIHRIDTSAQKALPEIHFNNKLFDVSLSPDGHTAVALVEGSVVLLDGSTGEIRKKIDGFKRPQRVIFSEPEHSTGGSN